MIGGNWLSELYGIKVWKWEVRGLFRFLIRVSNKEIGFKKTVETREPDRET